MSPPDRLWYLFAAYSAFWLLLALFLARLGRRHRALERELRELERRLERGPLTHESSAAGAAGSAGAADP